METIQVLADALPKIVPYVLINHREVSIYDIFLIFSLLCHYQTFLCCSTGQCIFD